MEREGVERPVKIVGIMLPWSDIILLSLQIAVVQAVLVGVAFFALKIVGVV